MLITGGIHEDEPYLACMAKTINCVTDSVKAHISSAPGSSGSQFLTWDTAKTAKMSYGSFGSSLIFIPDFIHEQLAS